jgi:hypothetical protein
MYNLSNTLTGTDDYVIFSYIILNFPLKGSDDRKTQNHWVSGLCPSFGILNK